MPPFRFGVQLSRAASGPAWRDDGPQIEALGYSTLFIPDHFEDQFGPLVALTVAAEATTTLRVGSLVFGNDFRHPMTLAKEIATLDLCSEGRVEFGLGAGWMTTDYEQSGIEADDAGTRISRMAESLAVLKSLWSSPESHLRRPSTTGSPAPSGPRAPSSGPTRPSSSAAAAGGCWASPPVRPTSSGSTRAWPPATSVPRSSPPPPPSTTTSGSRG